MARNGTARGGARSGAGRKPKALDDRVKAKEAARAIQLPDPPQFKGEDVPPLKEQMIAQLKKSI